MNTSAEWKLTEYLSAAALIASGEQLLRIDPPAGQRGRCAFAFRNENGRAEKAFQKHQGGTLGVSSREMSDAIESLKTRMFALRGGL